MRFLTKSRTNRALVEYLKVADHIRKIEPNLRVLSNKDLCNKTKEFSDKLIRGYSLEQLIPESFAVVREAARRTIGLRHFDVQVVGGIILHYGYIAEISTGEGKTLVATLPTYLNALSGYGVHLITVNDYLAERDADSMGQIYTYLGLTVGYSVSKDREVTKKIQVKENKNLIISDYNKDKQNAYEKNITYVTAQELAFDYLRTNLANLGDRLILKKVILNSHDHKDKKSKLNFAIIDEVDSILIDKSLNPCLISIKSSDNDAELLTITWETVKKMISNIDLEVILKNLRTEESRNYRNNLSSSEIRDLVADMHFNLEDLKKTVTISDPGSLYLEEKISESILLETHHLDTIFRETHLKMYNYPVADLWTGVTSWPRHAESLLRARVHYVRNKDYIVSHKTNAITRSVIIVDPSTGRLIPRSRWSDNTHQAIEVIEGCPVLEANRTTSSITYQALFKMYAKIAGMSGTVQNEEEELFHTYRLSVVSLPTNKPLIRIDKTTRVFGDEIAKYRTIIELIKKNRHVRRPVLIGTESIAQSLLLSKLLDNSDIIHTLLNASPDYSTMEAQIIAHAGELNSITVSTNMSGRGTDILLGGNPKLLTTEHLSIWMYLFLSSNRINKAFKYWLKIFRKYRNDKFPFNLKSVYKNMTFHKKSINQRLKITEVYGYFSLAKVTWSVNKRRAAPTTEEINQIIIHALKLNNFYSTLLRNHDNSSSNTKINRFASKTKYILSLSNHILLKLEGDAELDTDQQFIDFSMERSRTINSIRKACVNMGLISREFCKKRAKYIRKLGGLVVILDGLQTARRLEKQLRGRAGRLGDPGLTYHYVSLEEHLIRSFSSIEHKDAFYLFSKTNRKYRNKSKVEEFLARPAIQKQLLNSIRGCQLSIERYYYGIRRETTDYGNVLESYMRSIILWRKNYLVSDSSNLTRTLHYVLQSLADHIVDSHLLSLADQPPVNWGRGIIAIMGDIRCIVLDTTLYVEKYQISSKTPTLAKLLCVSLENFLEDYMDVATLLLRLVSSSTTGYVNLPPVRPILSKLSSFEHSLIEERHKSNLSTFGIMKPSLNSILLPGISSDIYSQIYGKKVSEKGYFAAIYESLRLYIGDILIYILYDKLWLARQVEPRLNPDVILQQQANSNLNEINMAWSVFLDTANELKLSTSFRVFASEKPLEEYKIEMDRIFRRLIIETRNRMARKLVEVRFGTSNFILDKSILSVEVGGVRNKNVY